MLPKMRYRLGLDIGTTSIGWCMVRLDGNDKPNAVIRMGVRIFPDGRNPKDGTSLAVTRRLARQMRRRRDRFIKRRTELIDALVRHGFFPEDVSERKKLISLDPYVLRKRGLSEALTGPEFGRALFHINQRRGFQSNRKTDRASKDYGAVKKAIIELQVKLNEEGCRTLGEWLANRHEARLSVRARLRGANKLEQKYDFYADRSMVEHEFDVLWEKQSEFNPRLFNENARRELKDILLFQRPLKPVSPGRCTFFPSDERAPLALPSVQRFRILQELNNLRIIGRDFRESPLTLEQRDRIAELLETGDVTFATLTRHLKLPGATKYNLEGTKRDRLKGNSTSIILSKSDHFGERWGEFSDEFQDEIVEKILDEPSISNLIDWLVRNTGVSEDTATRISDARLPEGYGRLGRKAVRLILPELKRNVVSYSDAVVKAGIESHSRLYRAEVAGEVLDRLPYYGEALERHVSFGTCDPKDAPEKRFGKIANPTVHIGLNQVRKVVNAMIGRYGHPSEIVVELARDLKLGREARAEIEREQRKRQDLNEKRVIEACAVLGMVPEQLSRSARRELSQKMQLWYELNPQDVANRRCPYTGEQISIERLLSNEVEIDHILPYSRTLDDSLNNKTVALRRANRYKGNRTPYEAFGVDMDPDYDYGKIMERASLMPRDKAKRFGPDGYQRWLGENKDFLARALNDTAYLSRIAKEYLSLICPPNKVRVIPGRMTALLRDKFGLNQLLSEIGSKNRNDHRHHAIDAAVVAVTDQGLLQRFSEASARARQLSIDRLVDDVPLPWTKYREHVSRALQGIVVSYKPDHGYEGEMHESTSYRPPHLDPESKWRTRGIGGGKPGTKEAQSNAMIPISSSTDKTRHARDEAGNPLPYKGYVSGSNYCVEIWRNEKGDWSWDVISTFKAYQIVRELGVEAGVARLRHPTLSQSGQPLVMRLMINDLVKFEVDGQMKVMRVVKIKGTGQVYFAEHYEANVDKRDSDTEDSFKYVSKYPGALKKARARRVTVSEIGDLRDPGFRE